MKTIIIVVFVILMQVHLCRASYEQMAVSSKGLSMGNAVTACPPGVMALHYNPAGLTRLKEKEFTFGLIQTYSVKIKSKFNADPNYTVSLLDEPDPVAGTKGETTDGVMYVPLIGGVESCMFVPNAGISSRKPESRWTFAFGMYAPFMMGFDHGHANDPARFGGKTAYSQRFIYAAPGVACNLSETFSIGLSIGLGQTAIGLNRDFRAPNELSSTTEVLGEATVGLEIPIMSELTLPQPWFNGGLPTYETMAKFKMDLRDDLDTSFNIGLLWHPFNWFSFGACYQSEARSRPTGSYSFKYSEQFKRFCDWFGQSPTTVQIATIFALPYYGMNEQKGNMVIKKFIHPQRAQFGIMLKPLKMLKLTSDISWTNWSSIKKETYIFDQDIQLFQVANFMGYPYQRNKYVIQRHLDDTINICFGLELQLLNRLALRCGYEDRESYVRDNYFSLSLPIQDMKIYSAGLGIEIGRGWSVDIAASLMESDTYINNYNQGSVMNSSEFFFTLHNPYPGLDYEQKTDIKMFGININYAW